MVRLKGINARIIDIDIIISIPYGSIKSPERFLLSARRHLISIPYGSIKSSSRPWCLSLMPISIPYGSIKSRTATRSRRTLPEFQFLMVRLKERCGGFRGSRCCISIPYGSIKSLPAAGTCMSASWFQFLMVRLKESHQSYSAAL